MTHFSRRTAAIAATLLVAITGLGACGGSDSDAGRTRNAEVVLDTEESSVLERATNLRVKFEKGNMIFDFDKPTKGLPAEGHFISMYWEVLNGSNSIMLSGDLTSGSTPIFPFMRGTKLNAYVRSYTNATRPSSIADSEKIDITIPMVDEEPAKNSAVEPPTDASVEDEISKVDQPILNVPPDGTQGEIKSDSIIENLPTEVPQDEVEKIEILIRTPDSESAENWKPVSAEGPTPYSIPADATSVTLRVTTTDGNVIEHEKQVVHVASNGQASPPEVAPAVTASTTTVVKSETTIKKPASTKTTTPSSEETDEVGTENTVATEEESVNTTVPEPYTDTTQVVASDSSDDSSSQSPLLWILIAIIAILATLFGAKKMRDQRKK
jgi:hypothetical protein